jgi:hypothetical protein
MAATGATEIAVATEAMVAVAMATRDTETAATNCEIIKLKRPRYFIGAVLFKKNRVNTSLYPLPRVVSLAQKIWYHQ